MCGQPFMCIRERILSLYDIHNSTTHRIKREKLGFALLFSFPLSKPKPKREKEEILILSLTLDIRRSLFEIRIKNVSFLLFQNQKHYSERDSFFVLAHIAFSYRFLYVRVQRTFILWQCLSFLYLAQLRRRDLN